MERVFRLVVVLAIVLQILGAPPPAAANPTSRSSPSISFDFGSFLEGASSFLAAAVTGTNLSDQGARPPISLEEKSGTTQTVPDDANTPSATATVAPPGGGGPPALPQPKKGSPKLESAVDQLVAAYDAEGIAAAADLGRHFGPDYQNGTVRVVVEAAPGTAADVRATAEGLLGGKIEATNGNLIQMLLHVSTLRQMAGHESVNLLRRPLRPLLTEVTSEGVSLSGANVWQTGGVRGTGVKVGIVDVGFTGYTALLGGELPASVTARSFRYDGDITGGGEVHGTAVAEVIHDMAPDAALYLTNISTDVEFGTAVDWLIGQGVHVISASLAWMVTGPGRRDRFRQRRGQQGGGCRHLLGDLCREQRTGALVWKLSRH